MANERKVVLYSITAQKLHVHLYPKFEVKFCGACIDPFRFRFFSFEYPICGGGGGGGGGQGEENNSTVMNRVYLKPAADD